MVDFIFLALDQIDKGRQVAISIQPDVKLSRPFGLLVLGPREQRERQLDQRGIQQVDLPVKLEGLVARRHRLTAGQQALEQLLIEGMWLLLIAAGQRCSAERFESQVIELVGLSAEIIHHVPQAAAAGQLGSQHGDKLAPAGKRPGLLPHMILIGKGLKFMSRKNSYYLRKNGVRMGHGSELLIVIMVLANSL
jgi:hypothetical protein